MTPLRRQNLVSSSVAALFIVVATTIIGIVLDGRSSSSQVYYYSHIDDSRQLSISADASFLGDPRTVTLKTPANDGRTTLDSAAVDTKIKITETLTYTDIINNAAPLPQYDLSSAVQAAICTVQDLHYYGMILRLIDSSDTTRISSLG